MATNKNQHFVPRCYLRSFTYNSENKAINLFNIERLRFIELAPVKHQCSGDYFYGEDPLLEKAIQFMEGSYASSLHEIFSNGYQLSDLHRTILRRFWLLQYLRTEAASKRAVEVTEDVRETIGVSKSEFNLEIREAVQDAMMRFSENMGIIDDLKICLLRNKTNEPFVTSDDPAVLSNRWHLNDQRTRYKSFGLKTSGNLIILPLSPDIMCLGYDGDVYSVPHKRGWVEITNKIDVRAFNQHQFLNCKANIFVRDSMHSQFVHDSFVEASSLRPVVRHRINYAIRDYDDGDFTRYKVIDPEEAGDHQEALIHMETLHARPSLWPRQIKWRRKGAVYTNGTGIGYVRHTHIEADDLQGFRKEIAKK